MNADLKHNHSRYERSSNGSSQKRSMSKDVVERLYGNYDKSRHICSTCHRREGFHRPKSQKKLVRIKEEIEYVDLEIRPCSVPPSMRDA